MIYRLNPKLIIVDLELPPGELSGLCKMLSGPPAKITRFITPHTNVDETVLQLIKHGYDHFVVRPLEERLLIKTVREIAGFED